VKDKVERNFGSSLICSTPHSFSLSSLLFGLGPTKSKALEGASRKLKKDIEEQ
jgi:hypothetical protein